MWSSCWVSMKHSMAYVAAAADRLPVEGLRCDLHAQPLDHVDDLGAAVAEITRVAAPGAVWLVGRGRRASNGDRASGHRLGLPRWLCAWRVESAQRLALDSGHEHLRFVGEGGRVGGRGGLLVARLARVAG